MTNLSSLLSHASQTNPTQNLRNSLTLTKDRKGDTWIITHTDAEGFHRQMNLTRDDLLHLMNLIIQSDV